MTLNIAHVSLVFMFLKVSYELYCFCFGEKFGNLINLIKYCMNEANNSKRMKTFSFAVFEIIKKVERIKERFFLRWMSGYYADADEIIFAWLKLWDCALYSLCKKQKRKFKAGFVVNDTSFLVFGSAFQREMLSADMKR